jgi:predicted nuclease of predicted toxin-antitoxin system
MNIKLDENLGDIRISSRLKFAGHDVATVRQQGLTSAPDKELIEVCRQEERCLVTLDRGFGNRIQYRPQDYAGIVLIRLPQNASFSDRIKAINVLILALEEADVNGKLWIVQDGTVQEYRSIESKDVEL